METLSNHQHFDHFLKVLGIQWDVSTDKLVFDLGDIHVATKAVRVIHSKRDVMGVTCTLYKPKGIQAPFTVSFKTLFQSACEMRLEWDDLFLPELLPTWKVVL